jgi:hypothetical protein
MTLKHDGSPPHSATVSQARPPHAATSSRLRAPHPATVLQRRAATFGNLKRPPHPATLPAARLDGKLVAQLAQAAEKKKKWNGPKDKAAKGQSASAKRALEQVQAEREKTASDIWSNYDWAHTLQGEVVGKKITGGHCRASCEANGMTVTRLTELTEHGYYVAKIVKGNAVKPRSTFFPDDWNEPTIKNAMKAALKNGNVLAGGVPLEHKSGIYFPALE